MFHGFCKARNLVFQMPTIVILLGFEIQVARVIVTSKDFVVQYVS